METNDGRAIKVSELASELAVNHSLVERVMADLRTALERGRQQGISAEAILWVIEDLATELRKELHPAWPAEGSPATE